MSVPLSLKVKTVKPLLKTAMVRKNTVAPNYKVGVTLSAENAFATKDGQANAAKFPNWIAL